MCVQGAGDRQRGRGSLVTGWGQGACIAGGHLFFKLRITTDLKRGSCCTSLELLSGRGSLERGPKEWLFFFWRHSGRALGGPEAVQVEGIAMATPAWPLSQDTGARSRGRDAALGRDSGPGGQWKGVRDGPQPGVQVQ